MFHEIQTDIPRDSPRDGGHRTDTTTTGCLCHFSYYGRREFICLNRRHGIYEGGIVPDVFFYGFPVSVHGLRCRVSAISVRAYIEIRFLYLYLKGYKVPFRNPVSIGSLAVFHLRPYTYINRVAPGPRSSSASFLMSSEISTLEP